MQSIFLETSRSRADPLRDHAPAEGRVAVLEGDPPPNRTLRHLCSADRGERGKHGESRRHGEHGEHGAVGHIRREVWDVWTIWSSEVAEAPS